MFEKGKIYKSYGHGLVEYIGVDSYFGEITYHFKSITYNADCYWTPDTIDEYINRVDEN